MLQWSELGLSLMLFSSILQLQGINGAWQLVRTCRPTLPAETRTIRWWRLDHLLKNIRENFAGDCKASKSHPLRCLRMFTCRLPQAAGYRQSFTINVTIHYLGSWCENWKLSNGDLILTSAAILWHRCPLWQVGNKMNKQDMHEETQADVTQYS